MQDNHQKFDVVIVGAGISGSIIARELSKQEGLSILIIEGGTGSSSDFNVYDNYNDQYYNALIKVPNSPYTDSKFSPSPSVLDPQYMGDGCPTCHENEDGEDCKACRERKQLPRTNGYFVQNGPFPFLSNYNRNVGGTTLHWLGTTPRMCPSDFEMQSKYGVGVDWPISYADMQPYYQRAEREIGVSAEVTDQSYIDITFEDGYVYPMQRIPQSYLDNYMSNHLHNKPVLFDGKEQDMVVISTPQGRNGMPNPAYNNGEGYTPVGAVGNPDLGQRCEGNSNCVPICPVQAKYSALKTLHPALQSETSRVTIIKQSPVSTIELDPDDPRKVKRVHYKTYDTTADGRRTNIQSYSVEGTVVVLAANAIENAKILLASDVANSSDQVGRNLMDHLVMLTWGFMPKAIGAYRGPGSTSGIPIARDGNFRSEHSAFWIEVGNWGWNWPANAPEQFLLDAVDGAPTSVDAPTKLYGRALKEYIHRYTARQFRIGWEIEQLPHPDNRVTIDENYVDDLGNYRPVINYQLTDYEKKGGLAASKLSQDLFKHLEVTPPPVNPDAANQPKQAGYFEYRYMEGGEEKTFSNIFNGAGHVVGCHRMGDDPTTSVVDANQKAHDLDNLFVTGCGSFPTLATSNPTLSLSALAFKSADAIIELLSDCNS